MDAEETPEDPKVLAAKLKIKQEAEE